MIGDWNFYSREINAQRCVVAFEMRMRGYEVVARPSWSVYDPMLQNKEWLSVFNYSPNEIKKCSGTNSKEVIASAKKIICSFGDEARFVVWFNWANYDSVGTHVIAAVCDEGSAVFLDPQTGLSNVERFLNFAAIDSVKILRIDNLSVNDKVKRCAMNIEEQFHMFEKLGDVVETDETSSQTLSLYKPKKIFYSLEKAIKKAEDETTGKVISAFDTDNIWIFNFDFEVGACLSVKFCFLKNSGVVDTFFPPDFPELNKQARKIFLYR